MPKGFFARGSPFTRRKSRVFCPKIHLKKKPPGLLPTSLQPCLEAVTNRAEVGVRPFLQAAARLTIFECMVEGRLLQGSRRVYKAPTGCGVQCAARSALSL